MTADQPSQERVIVTRTPRPCHCTTCRSFPEPHPGWLDDEGWTHYPHGRGPAREREEHDGLVPCGWCNGRLWLWDEDESPITFDATTEHHSPDPLRKSRPLIYIAGPYSSDPVGGLRDAIEAADWLWQAWRTPSYVPHLSHLHDLMAPRHYREWIALDLHIVEHCTALWRLEGHSPGADLEVDHAEDRGIPVLHSRQDVKDFVVAQETARCPA